MFSNGDYLTEIIAHFIGHFEIAEEQARMRNAHDAFNYQGPDVDPLADPRAQATPFKAPVVPLGYDPDIPYTPSRTLPDTFLHGQLLRFEPPLIEIPNTVAGAQIDRTVFAAMAGEARPGPLFGEAPGSLAFVVQQHRVLFDDDTIVIGDPEEQPLPVRGDTLGALERLVLEAGHAASGLRDIPVAMTETGAGDFTKAAATALTEISDPTATGATLDGTWINGMQSADEAPELGDYLPEPWASEVEDEETPSSEPIHINAATEDTSMTVETGGNLSVSQATIVNAGLAGTTLAVAGDVYQLDVIIQTTAWSDMDDFSTWPFEYGGSETLAINLASFTQETQDAAGERADANPGVMPTNWEITTVDGDLVFFKWLYQYNFASDTDLLSLTATGTTTTITSGENAGMDQVSLSNLGKLYDVIMVGGNLYDTNYISQTVALYDNDTLSAVGAFEGQSGSAWGGNNLLWNQAEIHNIGAGQWSTGLPEHYSKAMTDLDSGKMSMPMAFANDPAFEGSAGLRVLYVKGSVFDLNYIEQKTILADSDTLAVYAKNAVSNKVDWSIATGNNALVNTAGILDFDGNGHSAFVGGSTYSTAMLIQSNLIETGSGYSWSSGSPFVPRGDALASEVIAFLDDEVGTRSDFSDPGPVGAMAAGPTLDVMDHILA